MHTHLYAYLHDGSNLEQLLNLNYPLEDGTTFAHIELAIALRNKGILPAGPQDKLAHQILTVYKALNEDTPCNNEDRQRLANINIYIGIYHHYDFNGLIHDISFITLYFQAAMNDILCANEMSEKLLILFRTAFRHAKDRYFPTEIGHLFWSIAESSFSEDVSLQSDLMQKLNALLSYLNSDELQTEEKRIFLSLTINLMKLLLIAFNSNALPNNAIKKLLTKNKNVLDVEIVKLQNQPTLTLAALIKSNYLDPFIKDSIEELTRMTALQNQDIELLKEKFATTDKESLDDEDQVRHAIMLQNAESIQFFNETRHDECVNSLKTGIILYKKLKSLTDDDYRELSESERAIGNFYMQTPHPNHNTSYALRHYANSIINRRKIVTKTDDDQRFIFQVSTDLIKAIATEPHEIAIQFNIQSLVDCFCHDALRALVAITQTTHDDITQFVLTLQHAVKLLPANHPNYYFWLIAEKFFLTDVQLALEQINIVHNFHLLTSTIRDSIKSHWSNFKAPLANLLKLLQNVYHADLVQENALIKYLTEHNNELANFVQLLTTTSHANRYTTNIPLTIYGPNRLSTLEQQLKASTNPAVLFKVRKKRSNETEILALEVETKPSFSSKKPKIINE